MHHIVLERWSQGATVLHRVDPRAKLVALLALLITLATAKRAVPQLSIALLALLCAALRAGRIPVWGAIARAAVALPFAGMFAGVYWLAGDPARGADLVLKSYVSALAVLAVVATTPLPALLRGLERMKVPLFLLTVAQFVYRYLFVISEEAQHMVKAAGSRGSAGPRRIQFAAAAGALAVLFARSYGRARDIHHAMLARGFGGRLPSLDSGRFRGADAVFAALASLAPVAARLGVESIR